MYSYCLFCATMKCGTIAFAIRQKFGYTAFSPRIVQRKWVKGQCLEEVKPYLPGYVFVYSEERMTDYRQFYGMDGVIRRVGRREDGYELEGPDLDFAMKLLERDGLVGSMKACHIGEEVMLEDPLFSGCQGKVTAIDYRKERAKVEFVFDRNSCCTWIAVDDVRHLNPDGEEKA